MKNFYNYETAVQILVYEDFAAAERKFMFYFLLKLYLI
jgi:hypothetical protein